MTWQIHEGQITLCRFCADEPDAPEGPDYWPEVGIEITNKDVLPGPGETRLTLPEARGLAMRLIVLLGEIPEPLPEDGPAQLIEPGIGDIR